MGLFGRKTDENDDDIYDEDEYDELLTDSMLYIEAQPLESTSITVCPNDIYSLDTDAVLENAENLPYEFRLYFDTRRAFANALKICREEAVGFESYEGGRSASYSTSFEYDDHSVEIGFTLSKDSDSSPFSFTADIKIDE